MGRMNEAEAGRKLPQGWRWVRLGEVCDFQGGTQPSKSKFMREQLPGYVRLLQIQDFKTEEYAIYVPDDLKLNKCEETDVLVGRYGASVGRILRGKAGAYNVAIVKTLPNLSFISKDFLFYLLIGNGFQSLLRDVSARAAQAGFNKKDVEQLKIPLPPLPEQQRIAILLNEEMAMVERARAAAQVQFEAAKALPAAYLRAVFSSPEAEGWPETHLGEIGEIVSGITLGRKFHNGDTRKVPYLRVANVKDEFLDLTEVYEIEATEAEIKKLRLKFGDLLLTEGGDPDKLGRGMFWGGQIPECIHQNHIFRVRFDMDQVFPKFASYQIASPRGKAYFLAHAKRTTGIATINQKVLASLPLKVPPFKTQKFIAAILNKQITTAEMAIADVEERLDIINALPAALLRRAFNGEL